MWSRSGDKKGNEYPYHREKGVNYYLNKQEVNICATRPDIQPNRPLRKTQE